MHPSIIYLLWWHRAKARNGMVVGIDEQQRRRLAADDEGMVGCQTEKGEGRFFIDLCHGKYLDFQGM